MTDHKLLHQDEIDALLKSSQVDEQDRPDNEGTNSFQEEEYNEEDSFATDLTAMENEVLGEIGNSSMSTAGDDDLSFDQLRNAGGQDSILSVDPEKLQMLLDIPLKVSVVLGRAQKRIKDVLQMTPGAIVELEALVDEPVEILVNGKLVAKGEVVVVNEDFGVKVTSILSPRERINRLPKLNG